MVLANSTHACAPAHTLHSYSHHPHPQPYLGECTLLLLSLRSNTHACAPAHTLHSYSHHPHPQPHLGECTLLLLSLRSNTHACAPAHTLHSYSHHPHPQPHLGECTLLLLGLRSVQHLEVGMEVHGLAFCGGSGGALRGAAGAAAVRGRGQEPVCACVCM